MILNEVYFLWVALYVGMFLVRFLFISLQLPIITLNILLGVTQGENLILLPMITYNFTTESSYNLT